MKNKIDEVNSKIEKRLFELKDIKYKDFQAKLIPSVNPDTIIGVRTPMLRKYATELIKDEDVMIFLNDLPHKYYDENNLHGFLIEKIKDYDTAISLTQKFLPFVDNWATCDTMSPKVFKKHKNDLFQKCKDWLKSNKTYTIRFGIEMLMTYFLDEDFNAEILELVSAVSSEEYYVNMMISWFFATALAKQYEQTLPYIENKKLSVWCHNKTIQKAVESYRITSEQKSYLRTLKVKNKV